MPVHSVPAIVVGRLPLYLRALTQLANQGQRITSSQDLSDLLGFSSAQIRKDLSYFGEFGKQGTGYEIGYLHDQLQKILKVDRVWEMVLIGAGDLGHALAHYEGFTPRGFRIAAIFDSDPKKIGGKMGQHVVQDVAKLQTVVKEKKIEVAILAVNAEHAQSVADQAVEAGIHAILNYAPRTLNVPPKIKVYDIDPVAGLQGMTFYL
ncbi:MAG TPA: redox-sensing transcriptional repressor Rex [Anaerolineae bacterium]